MHMATAFGQLSFISSSKNLVLVNEKIVCLDLEFV